MSDYTIKALDRATWNEFAAMVERNTGLFSGCWCTWFHDGVCERGPEERNPEFKRRMVEAGVARAALVYGGDDAVAWAEFGTPEQLPNIHHRKQYLEGVVAPPDYRITFIYVDKKHRAITRATTAWSSKLMTYPTPNGQPKPVAPAVTSPLCYSDDNH